MFNLCPEKCPLLKAFAFFPFFKSPAGARPDFVPQSTAQATSSEQNADVNSFTPSKIILTGEKKKTLHKEELTASETERLLKTKTEHHAVIMQKRRSKGGARKTSNKEAKVPKQHVCIAIILFHWLMLYFLI